MSDTKEWVRVRERELGSSSWLVLQVCALHVARCCRVLVLVTCQASNQTGWWHIKGLFSTTNELQKKFFSNSAEKEARWMRGRGVSKALSVAAHFENVLASGTVLPNVMCTPSHKPPYPPITTPLRSRPFVWGVAIKTRNKSWKLQHTKHLITLCTTSWKCKLATTPPRI